MTSPLRPHFIFFNSPPASAAIQNLTNLDNQLYIRNLILPHHPSLQNEVKVTAIWLQSFCPFEVNSNQCGKNYWFVEFSRLWDFPSTFQIHLVFNPFGLLMFSFCSLADHARNSLQSLSFGSRCQSWARIERVVGVQEINRGLLLAFCLENFPFWQ